MDIETAEEEVDGSIHSIHLRNFFCHENLEVTFNRNVNFIVGRNGSGKSAILTALVVGLGGRASATSRGSNLHSFIRKGANSATVEIKIKNNSAKAYKHHIYGDYITVIRTIHASGGSGYKVKSATGEVISTKFEEVNAITIAHDIQVDNPISVLNQDDARSFHASDSKKKYSLFRKATNLDQTEINYMRALENCEKATSIWNRKQEACKELAKELKKWETSYEQLQSRDEMETQNKQLQNEYYWSEVAELEEEANKVQQQYEKQNLKINKLMDKLNSIEQSYGNNNETIEALKSQIEEKMLAQTALRQEVSEFDEQARSAQSSLRQAQSSAGKYQEQLARERRKLADLEREIHNIESGSSASQRGKLEAAAERATAALTALEARVRTAQHESSQCRAHAARAAAAADDSRAALAAQQARTKQLKQQLRELESRGGDSLAVFGAKMSELCQRVREAGAQGHFSSPPRGPVGAMLKVKEKKWGGALEHIIGGSMQTFCVNNAADSRKLLNIMAKVYGQQRKPSVYCSKFLTKVHDVRRNKVRARGFSSALDALDIADPVIANFLIDTIRIEGILLVDEHEDAVRLSDNVENVPEKLSRIVTLDSSEYFPAPNYRSYGGAGRPARCLALSTADRKRQVQAEIQEAEAPLTSLEDEAESAANEAKKAKQMEVAAGRALHALMAEKHEAEGKARAATAALDTEQAPHHTVLVEEQEITNQKVSSLKQKLDEASEVQTKYKRRADELDAEMKRAKGELAKTSAAVRALKEELDQEQLKIDQGVTERKMCAQKLKEDKEKLKQVSSILEERRAVVADKTRQAEALCPRVPNPREKSLVCNELKKTQLKLNAIRSDGLTKTQVAEKLLAAEAKYSKVKVLLDRLGTLINEVQKTSDKHLKFCHKVQTYIARRVQHCFQAVLTLRGYTGRMDISHANGSLEMFCSGREAGGRAATATTSLSGGERSYSTVAFVMSLWDCVELPFYFMDEFDVFMDNVNRKIVMELLMDHALKNAARQFVFLTPQETAVAASQHVKIHRMVDPRR